MGTWRRRKSSQEARSSNFCNSKEIPLPQKTQHGIQTNVSKLFFCSLWLFVKIFKYACFFFLSPICITLSRRVSRLGPCFVHCSFLCSQSLFYFLMGVFSFPRQSCSSLSMSLTTWSASMVPRAISPPPCSKTLPISTAVSWLIRERASARTLATGSERGSVE